MCEDNSVLWWLLIAVVFHKLRGWGTWEGWVHRLASLSDIVWLQETCCMALQGLLFQLLGETTVILYHDQNVVFDCIKTGNYVDYNNTAM